MIQNRTNLSLPVCLLLSFLLIILRLVNSPLGGDKPLMVTDWDALGYYMYAPAVIAHGDITKLDWLDEMDAKYGITGGETFQFRRHKNGNLVDKYLGGVSLMQLPFFLAGHGYAAITDHPPDGFSPPYQWAAAFSGIVYVILALFLLRLILLQYFSDRITTLTLLIIVLGTNLITYTSIKGAMSHSYIFFLYTAVIYTTIRWHAAPSKKWAALTGYLIGLATICRPTEAVMLFIPLLWGMENKAASKEKWALVKANLKHVYWVAGFGLLGVLPQIIYWKSVTGSFVYDVGSKWFFFNPWWRVLFGGEKGWFIYTPITVLFILGLFLIRKFKFHKSVIVYGLLNIWVVISWSDWNYGASYSTRALVQSYPVLALALAGLLLRVEGWRWRKSLYALSVYLVAVNLFQLWQYDVGIIHFEKNTFRYYSRIYLDPSPSALDLSLIDTDELLDDPENYQQLALVSDEKGFDFALKAGERHGFFRASIPEGQDRWLHYKATIRVDSGIECGFLTCKVSGGDSTKATKIRMHHALADNGKTSDYEFFMRIPENFGVPKVIMFMENCLGLKGRLEDFSFALLSK